jgi:tetratricopeptide (TPR) repeat protein
MMRMGVILLFATSALAGPEEEVQILLNAWQVEQAAIKIEPLLAAMPEIPAIQAAAARVKFHQQRYADALDLMRRAKVTTGRSPGQYELIRATFETTKNFVRHSGGRVVLRMSPGADEVLVPYLLKALNQAIDVLAPRFGVKITAPISVEIYPSAEAFSAVSTLDMKSIKTSGTIALCKFDRLMLISPRATLRGYDWLDTLSHELIHLLISRRSHNTVPIWLHEGLAKYHESGWRKPFGEPLPVNSAALLARALNRDELITFAQMSPSMAYLPSQEATATAFAEVHTAVEYLLEKYGEKSILLLLDGLRDSGGDLDFAFRQVSGAGLASFERSWAIWLKGRRFETRDGLRVQALTFGKNRAASDDDDPARPEGEAGRFARLGDLLFRRGHRQAAAIEYARSVKRAGYGYPGLVQRLASSQIASGQLKEAGEVLKLSAERSPDDPRIHVLLGRLAVKAERFEQALDAYALANAINPFDPEVHEGMRIAAKALKRQPLIDQETKALAFLHAPPNVKTVIKKDQPHGFLSVTTSPWSEVIIDDESLHRASPLSDYPLSVGAHKLTLRNSALSLERHLDVMITLGQTTIVKVDLRNDK